MSSLQRTGGCCFSFLSHSCPFTCRSRVLIAIDFIFHPPTLLAPPPSGVWRELVDVIGHKAALDAGQGDEPALRRVHGPVVGATGQVLGSGFSRAPSEGNVLQVRPGLGQISFALFPDDAVNLQVRAVPGAGRGPDGARLLPAGVWLLPCPRRDDRAEFSDAGTATIPGPDHPWARPSLCPLAGQEAILGRHSCTSHLPDPTVRHPQGEGEQNRGVLLGSKRL